MMRFAPSAGSPPTAHRTLWGAVAVFARLSQALVSDRAAAVALAVAVAVALLAPLGPLTANRFHRDEAIYSSWGLDIASGRDLLVSGSPVDKPPLFLYVQAFSFLLFGPTEVAARLPSLVASVVSVALIYALGRSLYGRGVGLLAAFLLAASPFAILFAPTAFTDPMMVAFVLAGCLAAVRGRWGWAGVALGLAAITKQQGVFFLPLVVGLGWVSNRQIPNPRSPVSGLQPPIVSFVVAFLAVFGLAVGWDVARARSPGFLAQSLASYGGLSLTPATVWDRLLGFLDLLRYGTGSPALNGALLVGLPLLWVVDGLEIRGWRSPAPGRSMTGDATGHPDLPTRACADWVISTFLVLFLVGHSLVAFQVWDRYLLGLIPLLSLLLARVLTLPWRLLNRSPISSFPIPNLLYLLFVLGTLSFTLRPIRDASASRFPIGGDHGAYQGIEQVVAYFQAVPADTTLYHRWLGWHWRFYLWGSPYDFRAWTSPADLAAQAAARPPGPASPWPAWRSQGGQGQGQAGARRYVVFPSWRSSTEARLALAEVGLSLRQVHRAFRDDGSVSFVVYRIEEAR